MGYQESRKALHYLEDLRGVLELTVSISPTTGCEIGHFLPALSFGVFLTLAKCTQPGKSINV